MSSEGEYRGMPAKKGRGAGDNRAGRFEAYRRESFDDGWGSLETADPAPATELSVDRVGRAITYNRSPDVPFDRSVNPYRGCEHGCIYCFARPTHSFLGLSPGLDFESRIRYKPDAPARLADELAAPGYRCAPIAVGVNTDAYQPAEKRLGITREILSVLRQHRHPFSVITKSALVERDLDILADMAADGMASAAVSITTLDDDLGRLMEPRAAGWRRRLRVVECLSRAGVPVAVSVAPVIPALTDQDMERILALAAERGAISAGYVLLRLPHEIEGLFRDWLQTHFPARAAHVMKRMTDLHGGRAYRGGFTHRQRGQGPFAMLLAQRFRLAVRRYGLDKPMPALDCSRFAPPGGRQLDLL